MQKCAHVLHESRHLCKPSAVHGFLAASTPGPAEMTHLIGASQSYAVDRALEGVATVAGMAVHQGLLGKKKKTKDFTCFSQSTRLIACAKTSTGS